MGMRKTMCALCLLSFGAIALGAEETMGRFRAIIGDAGGCTVLYDGKPVVVNETPIVPDSTWRSLFPTSQSTLKVSRSEDGRGKTVVIERELEGVARYRKTVRLSEESAFFDLDFVLAPGVKEARQMQWFVHLPLQEGRGFTAERFDGVTDKGVIAAAPKAPTLVAEGFYRITLPTEAGEMVFDFSLGGLNWHLDDYVHGWAKRFIFFNQRDLTDEDRKTGVRRRLGFRVCPAARKSPPAQFATVDISKACNRGFRDEVKGDQKGGWTDEGDADLRNLPVGRQQFYGIPFDIIDPAGNEGRSCIVLRGRAWKGYPSKQFLPDRAGFDVGRKARTTYFLHTCAWPGSPGSRAARYVVSYEDGTRELIPLQCGFEMTDWCGVTDADRCLAAWRGVTDSGLTVGANLFYWENPHPEKAISSMLFESANDTAVPALLAVTLSDSAPRIQGTGYDGTRLTPNTEGWFSFACDLDGLNRGATDVSFAVEKPAGRRGFVTAKDGHLHFEDGARARFWGQNLDFGGNRLGPGLTREEAEAVAGYLARSGNNIVRLHCLDTGYGEEKGYLFSREHDDSAHFDAKALDRLDYLIAQLKKNGIYITIDLWGFRKFVKGDGVRDWQEWQKGRANSMQAGPIFNRRQHEIEKEYAQALLTHKNPYTGLRLVDDPALAFVSLFNEVELFQRWPWSAMPASYVEELTSLWNEWLLGRYPDRGAMAKVWGNALGAEEDPAKRNVRPVLDVGKINKAPTESDVRVNESLLFLYETEARHSLAMRDFLRSIGLRVPIASTGDLGVSKPAVFSAAALDLVDQHTYWDHPQDWRGLKFYDYSQVGISPFARSVKQPSRECPLTNVSRTAAVAVAGKPIVNTEWNIPWPNQHRAEGPLFMAAYGRLQDWDGLILYALAPLDAGEENRRWRKDEIVSFDILHDPARSATWQAAALMFLRGDCRPAQHSVDVGLSKTDAFWGRYTCGPSWQDAHGMANSHMRFLPYLCRVRTSLIDEKYEGKADVVTSSGLSFPQGYAGAKRALLVFGNRAKDIYGRQMGTLKDLIPAQGQRVVAAPEDPNQGGSQGDPKSEWLYRAFVKAMQDWGLSWQGLGKDGQLVSDTGELVWDYQAGVVSVDTPFSQGVFGFLGKGFQGKGESFALANVKAQTRLPFGAIMVTSLDSRPIPDSARLLLSAVSNAVNAGQRMCDMRVYKTVTAKGPGPVLTQPVQATVELTLAGSPKVYALGPKGDRLKALDVKRTPDGALRFEIGVGVQTVYYEIARE